MICCQLSQQIPDCSKRIRKICLVFETALVVGAVTVITVKMYLGDNAIPAGANVAVFSALGLTALFHFLYSMMCQHLILALKMNCSAMRRLDKELKAPNKSTRYQDLERDCEKIFRQLNPLSVLQTVIDIVHKLWAMVHKTRDQDSAEKNLEVLS